MKNRNFKSSTQTKVIRKAGRKFFIHLISTYGGETMKKDKCKNLKSQKVVLIGDKNQDE